ncbi:hypothetical protein XAP6164_1620027 [Xanthomonas phaseoli pv. phaseoli]|nr:hypothetical protein XAP6164_1620027 [Xanthomonas phaseoli pv. phaseoli]
MHRVQKALQAALAGQRKLHIDTEFDIGDLEQRVLIELKRIDTFAVGIDKTSLQTGHRRERDAAIEAPARCDHPPSIQHFGHVRGHKPQNVKDPRQPCQMTPFTRLPHGPRNGRLPCPPR